MLNKREIKTLVKIIKEKNYQQIFVDFYQPAYYSKFIQELKKNGIPETMTIVLIGNPLYDEKSCYEGLSDYSVKIRYNTCNELNEFYKREPITEGVFYYSDIEANGMVDIRHYKGLLKIIEYETSHIGTKKYTPLEAACYLQDAYKKNETYREMLDNRETQDELTSLYSIILRRCGALCYTYGTDSYQKNIIRLKDSKYKIDNIALIDPIWEMKQQNSRNSFDRFLVPIENDLYMSDKEVISIPISLTMGSPDYYAYVNHSNPIAITDTLGYAARLLQVMGWTLPKRQFESVMEEKEFYKAALENSDYVDKISYEIITKAVQTVRKKEHEYTNAVDEQLDARKIENRMQTRGNNDYISPAIKLLGSPPFIVEVERYTTNNNNLDQVHFINNSVKPTAYEWPRKKKRNETKEQYQKYLMKFYNDNFYNINKGVNNMEKMEEYMIDETPVDEIIIYRDINDSGRVFVSTAVLERFHLPKSRNEILVDNGEMVYEIDGEAATNIINNADNAYSPYVITYLYVQLNEEIIPYDEAISKFNEQGELKNPDDRIIPYNDEVSKIGEDGNLKNPDDRIIPYNEAISKFNEQGELKNPDDRIIPYRESASILELSDKQVIPYNEAISKFNEQGELKNPDDRIIPYNDEVSKIGEDGNLKNPDDRIIPYRESASVLEPSDKQVIPYNEAISKFNEQGELKNPDDRIIPYDESLTRFTDKGMEKVIPYDEAISKFNEQGELKNPDDRIIPYDETLTRFTDKGMEKVIPYDETISKFNEQGELKNPDDRIIPYDEGKSVIQNNDFIPGTNYRSPREKRPDESAEAYEAYLEGYYDGIVGQEELQNSELNSMSEEYIPGTDFQKPRVRREDETDEEYEAYLEEYYDSVFAPVEEENEKRLAA